MANQVEIDAHQLELDAQAALESGRRYFSPALATTYFNGRGRGLDDWAYYIAVIEDVGWHLEHWAVAPSTGSAVAFPLFVRKP